MVRAANEKSTSFYLALIVCFIIGVSLIYHDFGVIAFVMLVFVGIFGFGLRDKFSNESTASAYSVFNKDGKGIVGGFTANQFENQLRGPLGRTIDKNDPVKGSIAESQQNVDKSTTSSTPASDAERTARRKAAAEAAERRFNNQKEE
jgi:hypothetical protein